MRRKSNSIPRRRAASTQRVSFKLSKNRTRRPIQAKCRELLFGMKSCAFVCVRPVRAAMLIDRNNAQNYAIVHPSTKTASMWQTSYFDDRGPVGDSQRTSCNAALEDLPPRHWRIKEVK